MSIAHPVGIPTDMNGKTVRWKQGTDPNVQWRYGRVVALIAESEWASMVNSDARRWTYYFFVACNDDGSISQVPFNRVFLVDAAISDRQPALSKD